MDEKLLRHILGNLLTNAFKYSPAGGQVEFHAGAEDQHIVFTVRDHGIGIPAEDLPSLFESFHRAGNVGNIAGTGLGMAIVRRATDLHGGTITVDSEVGKGTSFRVELPAPASAH
jgi:signal transduction histidine kinase